MGILHWYCDIIVEYIEYVSNQKWETNVCF